MGKIQKFYRVNDCGCVFGLIRDDSEKMTKCFGSEITELKPNCAEASGEKHLPVVSYEGDTVTVSIGSAMHPMEKEHHIEWVYLQTEKGGQRKSLESGENPTVTFILNNDRPVAVFSYCNLHGLWSTEI